MQLTLAINNSRTFREPIYRKFVFGGSSFRSYKPSSRSDRYRSIIHDYDEEAKRLVKLGIADAAEGGETLKASTEALDSRFS